MRKPMVRRRMLATVLLLVAVSCGGGGGSGGSTGAVPPLPPGPPEPKSPQPYVLTHLVIDRVVVGSYASGSKGFVRLTSDGFDKLTYLPRVGSRLIDLRQAGRFSMKAWQEPCMATCRRTGKPIDRCSTSFTANGATIRILITATPGEHCRITIS